MVNIILDYIVWVQLLLVVAICTDRAGHIYLPLQYSFSIKPWKTVVAAITCTLIPFLAMIVPYMVALGALGNESFKCSRTVFRNGTSVSISKLFMCKWGGVNNVW